MSRHRRQRHRLRPSFNILTLCSSAENSKAPSAKIAASIFQEITYSNKDSLSAGIIVAGYDDRTGGEVYSVPLGGSLHKQDYAIAGSGSTVSS